MITYNFFGSEDFFIYFDDFVDVVFVSIFLDVLDGISIGLFSSTYVGLGMVSFLFVYYLLFVVWTKLLGTRIVWACVAIPFPLGRTCV